MKVKSHKLVKHGPELSTAALQKAIRSRFAYVRRDPFGGRRIYLENAGGTLKLKSVLRGSRSLEALPDNVGRSQPASKRIERAIAEGRTAVSAFLGNIHGTIVAEQSVTSMMFRLLRTIALNTPGGNIVTTCLDHASVYDATRTIANQHDLEWRVAPFDPHTGVVSPDDVAGLIDRNTVALVIIHASNILGTRNDVETIVRAARQRKDDVFVILDGAQHASHGLVDVESYGADAYVIVPYKIFARTGMSFAYLSDRLAVLPHDQLHGKPANAWDLGTRDAAAYHGMVEVVAYLRWLASMTGHEPGSDRDAIVRGMHQLELIELDLMRAFCHGVGDTPGLLDIDGVTVYGQTDRLDQREAIFAFNFIGQDTATVVERFCHEGISLHNRLADAYSGHTLKVLDINECVRVSASHYNTLSEIARFLRVLRDISRSSGR